MGYVPADNWIVPSGEICLMSLLNQLIGPVTGLLDKFIEDKDQKNALAHEISTLASKQATELAKGQLAVNAVEAKGSAFQRNWRPATGWVCVLGFAVNFLISPLAAGFGVDIPQADTGTMMPILMGLLGLGGLRSFEKTKQVEGK